MRTTSRLAHVVAIVATVLLTCTFAISALAAECPELVGVATDLVEAHAVAASGGYAYVVGDGLRVVDISTPSAPVAVGFVDVAFLPHWADAEVLGQYVYVVTMLYSTLRVISDLAVIDVSTPSAPELAGSLHWDSGAIRSIAVSEDYAYVVDEYAGLRVIDVSTPSAPVEVGFLETGYASGVAVSGEYAYVVGDGLRVVDISTPSAPVEVGLLEAGYAFGVAVSGDYAYVTYDDWPTGSLRVIDVSAPSAPVGVGFVEIPAYPLEVAVGDGYAYVIAGGWPSPPPNDRSLRVIAVSTPFAPVEVGFHEVPIGEGETDWGGLAVSDGSVFFAAGDGLYVFDDCGPLFADGFESGDTAAWSTVVP